jgi:hypothetical protein
MWPYWLLFAYPALMALRFIRERDVRSDLVGMRAWTSTWWIAFTLLVLMIGFRYEVGGDWQNYVEHLNIASQQSIDHIFADKDVAFSVLNWLAAQTSVGMYVVNIVSAVFFAWGLLVFCRGQPRPWLALVVAVPYLVIVVAMGYTRQGVAIGLAMLGLEALGRGRSLQFALWIIGAATWHKSAVILVPLALMAGGKNRWLTLLWVVVASALMFVLLVQETFDLLTTNYIEAKYNSSGAGIRIAMNALPATLFLLCRKRFDLPERQRTFWTWMSVSALLFVVMLAVSPSSTAIDRLALYWIPLQLFVWPRMPKALNMPGPSNALGVLGVIGYSAAVLHVWLVYADNSFTWKPYGFYPAVLFWAD